MNYQHNYHAGNFADVIKHLILTHVILKLHEKPTPFCIIDSHAGQGLYDLTSEAALKTGEAKKGVLNFKSQDQAHPLLAQYFEIITAHNSDASHIRFYPGSPKISQALLRPQDQLYVNELHPTSHETLCYLMKSDDRVKISKLDGYLFLKSILPPVQKRGVVLIDPPFEIKNEIAVIITALKRAVKCFAQGIYLIWYPVKNIEIINQLNHQIKLFYNQKILNVQFYMDDIHKNTSLCATGLLIINPPWNLDIKIAEILKIIKASHGNPQSCHYYMIE